ncbi:ribonuclease R [Loigolactobacillus coryniformis]|uniref:Ribonuclease R n=1 Tax=Loigolactobacillus coryniformis subsp. torquens DSM 20004 = KCTC 3535 TaxID=1423822 RepID=A0A2D1KQG7_9LACO|nr:ribonuclease R [Loigolactobacillus coryniformis]ATO44341.1 ribonuclease R [Loigolactobacillus coryniformis subsp. torquens DSM 20004 = KCTC 3535]
MKNAELFQAEVLNFLTEHANHYFTAEELDQQLKLRNAAAFKVLVQTLTQLEQDKKIKLNGSGHFGVAVERQKVSGVFHANDRGFGFISYDPELPDVYVSADNTAFALNGDEVEAEVIKEAVPNSGKGPEGKIVNIIKRNFTTVVGEFTGFPTSQVKSSGQFGYVSLTQRSLQDVPVFITDDGVQPQDGDMVVVDITKFPSVENPKSMLGIAKQDLGNKNAPGVDILSIVYRHGIPTEFPDAVMQEANEIPSEVQPEEKQGRRDLTDQNFVTIDGETSKDFDDAVVVWKMDNGHYHLGVSIADVAHYVTPGTALNAEAFERGTSTYLTDRVLPMLPERLSNGICSLNPQVERLTMTCEMEIDAKGNIVKHEIFPAVIKSAARMTYTAVNQILDDNDAEVRAEYAELVPMFEQMGILHKILWQMRHDRGAIDFDKPEAKIIVDSEGHPTDIVVSDRGTSERMIESFMLAANETVAEHYNKLHVPFLYRVHETPDSEKMRAFYEFINNIGVVAKGDSQNIKPRMLQAVLAKIEGQPVQPVIQIMMLRSMKQAKYADQLLGHFGLAAKYYTHFTSPIRRYPDLMVHRLIHWYMENGTDEEAQDKYRDQLDEIAKHSSEMERRSIDAERDTDDLKKAEFMLPHVGEDFDAVVSSVTKFGLFIELPNTVEGLVHISTMGDDYYNFIESYMAMVGEHTKKTYRVGQPVKVTLTDVDMDQSQINFKLLPDENTPTSDLGDLVERPKPRRNFQRREGSNNRRPGGNSNRNGNSRGGYRGNRNSSSNGNSHNRQGASNGNRNHSGASTNSNRNRRGGNGNHPFTIRNNQSHGEHK